MHNDNHEYLHHAQGFIESLGDSQEHIIKSFREDEPHTMTLGISLEQFKLVTDLAAACHLSVEAMLYVIINIGLDVLPDIRLGFVCADCQAELDAQETNLDDDGIETQTDLENLSPLAIEQIKKALGNF